MSSTLLLFDGFDAYSAVSAMTAAGKWGTVLGTPTLVTGRHGSPWQSLSFSGNGSGIIATLASSPILRVGFAFKHDNTTGGRILALLKADTTALFTLTWLETFNIVRMHAGQYTDAVIAQSADNLGTGVWHWGEVMVEQGATTKRAKLWIDGKLVIDFTGTTTLSANNFAGIEFGGQQSGLQIDDIAVWSESDNAQPLKGDSRVVPFYPTSDTVLDAGWVPSTGVTGWAVVDDKEPAGDSDTLDCTVVNDVAAFASTDTLPTNPATIHGVGITVRGLKSDSGTRTIKPLLRIGGVNYLGAEAFLATGIGDYFSLWETNPATAGAWDKAGVEGADFGVKLIS